MAPPETDRRRICYPEVRGRAAEQKTRRSGGFLWGVSSALGVAAQPVREFRERADAARFGAVAPVLQLAHELVARLTRALPQRCELGAHRVHGVKRARLRQALLEVRALGLAQRFFVAM